MKSYLRKRLSLLLALLGACIASLPVSAQSEVARRQARELLAPHGLQRFSSLLIQALETWIHVENLYGQGEYEEAKSSLDRLWAEYPPGHKGWGRARSRVREIFLGRYPCYYALRMLQTCVDWRMAPGAADTQSQNAVLGIVLVGKSRGVQPRNLEELEAGKGVEVAHQLDKVLADGDSQVLDEATRLFKEYVLAITKGRLALQVRVIRRPSLEVPVSTRARPRRHAGIARGGMQKVWESLSEQERRSTDWWWVIYPSHVPGRFADFEKTEFITGGMGIGPDGASPCFICNDLWLISKPPHLGKGPYTSLERRAYLPHWLQHEFFHHLYRTWPEFELEKKGHQWFNRAAWPKDFVGRYEPDYYYESLIKRLQTRAKPPLHIGLRYDQPRLSLFAKLEIESVLGKYEHRPVLNKWHRGEITGTQGEDGGVVLRWRNEAAVTWRLFPDLRRGILRTGKENPYYKEKSPNARTFRLALKRDTDGTFLPVIEGFRFQQGHYRRLSR